MLSGDADGQPLFPEDLSSFETQVSTNLLDWYPITLDWTLTNGSLLLSDPAYTNEQQRFYRVLEH
jgi:hypothetical protein